MDFELPEAIYGLHDPHCARDVAEPDEDVCEEDKRYEPLVQFYDVNGPHFGELQRIGRIREGFGMGPGNNPYLCLGWDGCKNGPTTHGGGGSFPSLQWTPGTPVLWRRVTTLLEYYRQASLSETFKQWHMDFTGGDKAACRKLVNDGFFAGTVHALFTAIFDNFKRHAVPFDNAQVFADPSKYVTGPWVSDHRQQRGGKFDVAANSAAVAAHMRSSHRDWSIPLYPSKPGTRAYLNDPISIDEWAQIQYGYEFTDAMQLTDGSTANYNVQQRKAAEFLSRCPVAKRYGRQCANTGILFDPAVWKSNDTQKVLCDLIMHDAYVRGNGWSSARQLLYAVRHYNVKAHGTDILKFKPRLWQLMDGLKKCRGLGRPKHPVTRAMLLWIRKTLHVATDEDDLRVWAAVLTAFHFMLRSSNYCARLAQGKFNMDYVLRICDVTLKRQDKVLSSNFRRADEVMVILGRSKTSDGGEVRSHFRARHSTLCVVSVMAELFERLDLSDKQKPLFIWGPGSNRPGEGVRYYDIMRLVQAAAEGCGRDTKLYGTHSLRRGGASSYVLAGATIDNTALFGGWASSHTVRRYIEPAAKFLMKDFIDKVTEGVEEPSLVMRGKPRGRDLQRFKAQRRAEVVANHL